MISFLLLIVGLLSILYAFKPLSRYEGGGSRVAAMIFGFVLVYFGLK